MNIMCMKRDHYFPAITALLLAPLAALHAAKTKRPNVFIVIDDDQSWLECSV
jgi:hypothetical protein